MEDDDIPIVRKNMAAMGHDFDTDLSSKPKSGAIIKDAQGTTPSDSKTVSVNESSMVEEQDVQSAPTLIVPNEGSSIVVVGPDGNEFKMTVENSDEQHVMFQHGEEAHDNVMSSVYCETYEGSPVEVTKQLGTPSTSQRIIQTATKKGYKHLTAKEKHDLCKWRAENPDCSLDEVINHFEPNLGRRIPKSTLIYTLQNQSDVMGDPLSRLSQYQVEPGQMVTPSTSQSQMPHVMRMKRYNVPRQYKSLTLKQKYDLCQWHEENPRCGHDEIIDHFEPLLGYRVSKSTLNNIFKESSVYLSMDQESPSTWTRKHKGAKEVKLFEDLLYGWVCEQIQLGGVLTRRAVGNKAIHLANECGYTDFLYSPMWVQVFLKRFQLMDKVHCES